MREKNILSDKEWIEVAKKIAKRSYCKKSKYSCIIVDAHTKKSVFGVNGPEKPNPICDSCKRKDIPSGYSSNFYKECPFLHAEEKAYSKIEPDMKELFIYIYGTPCERCCMQLANKNIKKLVFYKTHNFLKGIEFLKEKKIEIICLR